MISFKQLIDEHNQADSSHQHQHQDRYLFTRLKQNIMKKSLIQDRCEETPIHKQSVNQAMREHQLDFQILKLEKANLIVEKHFKTGISVQEIMKQVLSGLYQQVEQIMDKKSDNLKETKTSNHQQSTFGNTGESQSIEKEFNKSIQKSHLTPKIIEFTLGNKEASSGKSGDCHNNGEEVSEFFVNSKGLISKNIRQKVMGHPKLK